MTSAVITRGLTKRFGAVTALDALDLEIPHGSVYGVIGPNGAGKSTLMRLLLDILRPTSGVIQVLGQEPRQGGKELRGRVGYLPGELHLAPGLTGAQHIDFWASISGGDPHGCRRWARDAADRLGVDLRRVAGKLSKGNKQKLGVIQALMHQPELLILDEPSSGLDPLIQQTFLQMVREANAEGATVFLSSHILSEIEQVADRAVVLRAGRVVRESSVTDLRATAQRHLRAVLRATSPDAVATAVVEQGLGLEVRGAGDDHVHLTGLVEGRANDVVRLLGAFDVVDLVLSEPDLEETVLEIYSEPEPQPRRGAGPGGPERAAVGRRFLGEEER